MWCREAVFEYKDSLIRKCRDKSEFLDICSLFLPSQFSWRPNVARKQQNKQMTQENPTEDPECAFLVREESLPAGTAYKSPDQQDGAPTPQTFKTEEDEDEDPAPHSVANFHEYLLQQAGYGAFHLLVLFIVGLGLAADAVELFALGYILPSAEHELCMEEYHKTWLNIVPLIGMTIGALICGVMGDRIGRRCTLITALATNGIFGLIAACMPTYSLLLVTRLCSSIGIGGSLPIVFSYYSEFLVRKNRGRNLSFLVIFWALGGLFVAMLAWGMIPRSGVTLMETRRFQFGAWRTFLLLCSVPAIVSAMGTCFLPESPRYLLEMGRQNEALFIYKRIMSFNKAIRSGEEYQLAELDVPGRRPAVHVSIPSNRGLLREMLRSLELCWHNISQVFSAQHLVLTLILLVLWASSSFGYFGITVWLHETMKAIEDFEYVSRTVQVNNSIVENITLNSTIENTHFINMTFENVQFVHTLLSHCTFENCIFVNCVFSNIRSSITYFKHCVFYYTNFFDTDLYRYKFQHATMTYTHFYSTKGGCNLDFDINFKLAELFYENLFAQLAILPGTVLSAFVMNRVGRVNCLGFSLIMSTVIIACLWLAEEKYLVFGFETVFTFFATFGWNALDVISSEAYPANIRTTAYGILIAASRLATILSNIIVTNAVEVVNIVPLIISGVVMISGAICVKWLPETKDYLV